MALPNARIDQLPANGTFTGADLIPIWNKATLQTEYVTIESLIGTPTEDQNFEWVSGHPYLTDDVVTRGGNWYQALVNNTDITPGTDPATWSLVTRSPSSVISVWVAGIYTSANSFVFSFHKGYWDIYKINASSYPFNSTDIAAEELAAKWVSLISPQVRLTTAVAAGLLVLDFKRDLNKFFIVTIGEPVTWSIINRFNGSRVTVCVTFTTLDAQTFPANWIMSDVRKAGLVWTPLSIGKYWLEAIHDGFDWFVKISDEPYT